MNKPDCYKCKYRGNVEGDAHSCCLHPTITKNPMAEFFALVGIGDSSSPAAAELNIQANPHGVTSGWFAWPMNFDPVWLENCDGFKSKDKDA